ncbi:MAG: ABC transporter substrate-binding protein [Methylocystaceae bacterium]|nr:ABC transporter substrate-binding protein [Methylocystaceae bacterium]
MQHSSPALFNRRHFLSLASGFAAQSLIPNFAFSADPIPVKVVTNGGIENLTILSLLERQGFLASAGIQQTLVNVGSPIATLEALNANKAEICIVSGFNGLLPAIEKGAPVKVVGAALRVPALAVYSSKPEIKKASDLVGRTIGIGPDMGLLHVVMIALLQAKGIDPKSVKFVNVGSNAEVYADVKAGKVDAGPSDVSNSSDAVKAGLTVLADGRLWTELPDYPYQLAYASEQAIKDNREGLVRALAAYGKLFRFISSAESRTAYEEARKAANNGVATTASQDAWSFVQANRPYDGSPEVTQPRLDFLQKLHVSLGLQKSIMPIEKLADLSLGRDAMKLI